MIIAVATQDAVVVYDTQQMTPLATLSGLHYSSITDLAWSPDGLSLLLSSQDGFCSIVSFDPSDLGVPISAEQAKQLARDLVQKKVVKRGRRKEEWF
jgi:chromatin assembly factor 1 subunit B